MNVLQDHALLTDSQLVGFVPRQMHGKITGARPRFGSTDVICNVVSSLKDHTVHLYSGGWTAKYIDLLLCTYARVNSCEQVNDRDCHKFVMHFVRLPELILPGNCDG